MDGESNAGVGCRFCEGRNVVKMVPLALGLALLWGTDGAAVTGDYVVSDP